MRFCTLLIDAVSRYTQKDLRNRGDGRAQTDVEEGSALYPAHPIDRRDPYAERAEYPLRHDENGFSAAVEVADKTKENGGEKAVDGIGFQIVMGESDHFRLAGEDGRQQIAGKKCGGAHNETGDQGGLYATKQCFAGTLKFAGSVVLGNKRGNGLHIGEATSIRNMQTFSATPTAADSITPILLTTT